jgi:membrane associated rhomboid family serine protease
MISLIPIHDENPTRRTAIVTLALIGINVAIFLIEPFAVKALPGARDTPAQECQAQAFFDRYAAIPKELTSGHQLGEVASGAASPRGCLASRPPYQKSPFVSVLTAMFLHGGWLHLLGNMLFLWVFGNNVEDRLGRVRYMIFYLVCGYLATYGFALAQPHSTETLVGASGAIAGVLGAYLVLYPTARVTSLIPFLLFLPARLPAWIVLGSWFVLQWIYSSQVGTTGGAGVAYLAHVVGFLAGIVLIVLLGGLSPRRRPPPQAWRGRYGGYPPYG